MEFEAFLSKQALSKEALLASVLTILYDISILIQMGSPIMQQETYLVFLQNTKTGEEFTAPANAPINAYEIAMGRIRQQYPAPQFKVHTAYSVADLHQALNGLSRWPGLASSVQSGTQKPKTAQRQASVRVTLGEATQKATGAVIQKETQSQLKEPTPAQPSTSSQKQNATAPMPSAIAQLSKMRQQTPSTGAEHRQPAPMAQNTPPNTSQVSVIEQLKAFTSR